MCLFGEILGCDNYCVVEICSVWWDRRVGLVPSQWFSKESPMAHAKPVLTAHHLLTVLNLSNQTLVRLSTCLKAWTYLTHELVGWLAVQSDLFCHQILPHASRGIRKIQLALEAPMWRIEASNPAAGSALPCTLWLCCIQRFFKWQLHHIHTDLLWPPVTHHGEQYITLLDHGEQY